MGDQKNLILAIVLSVAIIFIFQILFPVQTPTITSSENIEEMQPAASIDDTQIITKDIEYPINIYCYTTEIMIHQKIKILFPHCASIYSE